MYKVVGLKTGKIYSRGDYKSECLREMHKQYPSSNEGATHRKRRNLKLVYPEPLVIYRRNS